MANQSGPRVDRGGLDFVRISLIGVMTLLEGPCLPLFKVLAVFALIVFLMRKNIILDW